MGIKTKGEAKERQMGVVEWRELDRKERKDRIINYFQEFFPFCPFLLPITHHQNLMLAIKFCSGVEAHYRKSDREFSGRKVLQYLNRRGFIL